MGSSSLRVSLKVHPERHALPRELCVLHCDLSQDGNIFDAHTLALLEVLKSVQLSVTVSEERALTEVQLKGNGI